LKKKFSGSFSFSPTNNDVPQLSTVALQIEAIQPSPLVFFANHDALWKTRCISTGLNVQKQVLHALPGFLFNFPTAPAQAFSRE